MLAQDIVHGDTEITEQVLIDLINCPSIQRLKGVSQLGLPQEYLHNPTFSRYEHSVGVMILLRKLGASINEQVAGLLHDVSHTAFSHLTEWILGDPSKGDHQDKTLEKFVTNSEIPSILKKHGMNTEEVVIHDQFTLLEQDSPFLCADRVDYTLRELIARGRKDEANIITPKLTTFNGHIVLKDQLSAEKFSEVYIQFNNDSWAGVESKTRYHIFAEALKKAIDLNYITIEDLNGTDKDVIDVLIEKNNPEINKVLSLLRNRLSFKESEEEGEILLKKKFRHVDPEIIVNGEVKILSECSEDYKQRLTEEKENSKKKIYVTILKN